MGFKASFGEVNQWTKTAGGQAKTANSEGGRGA